MSFDVPSFYSRTYQQSFPSIANGLDLWTSILSTQFKDFEFVDRDKSQKLKQVYNRTILLSSIGIYDFYGNNLNSNAKIYANLKSSFHDSGYSDTLSIKNEVLNFCFPSPFLGSGELYNSCLVDKNLRKHIPVVESFENTYEFSGNVLTSFFQNIDNLEALRLCVDNSYKFAPFCLSDRIPYETLKIIYNSDNLFPAAFISINLLLNRRPYSLSVFFSNLSKYVSLYQSKFTFEGKSVSFAEWLRSFVSLPRFIHEAGKYFNYRQEQSFIQAFIMLFYVSQLHADPIFIRIKDFIIENFPIVPEYFRLGNVQNSNINYSGHTCFPLISCIDVEYPNCDYSSPNFQFYNTSTCIFSGINNFLSVLSKKDTFVIHTSQNNIVIFHKNFCLYVYKINKHTVSYLLYTVNTDEILLEQSHNFTRYFLSKFHEMDPFTFITIFGIEKFKFLVSDYNFSEEYSTLKEATLASITLVYSNFNEDFQIYRYPSSALNHKNESKSPLSHISSTFMSLSPERNNFATKFFDMYTISDSINNLANCSDSDKSYIDFLTSFLNPNIPNIFIELGANYKT